MDTKYAMYHDISEGGCGGIAFYTTRHLIEGIDNINGCDVIQLDGTHPIDNVDRMICGTCNQPISGDMIRYGSSIDG